MTKFDLLFKHRGLENGAIGVNFLNSKFESFVYLNPAEIWEGDYDKFVEDVIRHTLLEFICSKCQVLANDSHQIDNPTIEEGKIMASSPLCNENTVLDALFGNCCPCEKMAKKMLGDS